MDEIYDGSEKKQQQEIENVINKVYSKINDDFLKGLTNPMNIEANNKGWGYVPPGPSIPIDDHSRILPKTIKDINDDLSKNYNELKTKMDSNRKKLDLKF